LRFRIKRGDGFSNEVLVRGLINFASHNFGDQVKDDFANASGCFVDGPLARGINFTVRGGDDAVRFDLGSSGRFRLHLIRSGLGSRDDVTGLVSCGVQDFLALATRGFGLGSRFVGGVQCGLDFGLSFFERLIKGRQDVFRRQEKHNGNDD
jgi:hypothetical protein